MASYHTGQRSRRPHGQQPLDGLLIPDFHTRTNDATKSERRREFAADGPWRNEDLVQDEEEEREREERAREELYAYRDKRQGIARPGEEFIPRPRGSHIMPPTHGTIPIDYPRAGDLSRMWHDRPPPPHEFPPEHHPKSFAHVMPPPGMDPFVPRWMRGPAEFKVSFRDERRREKEGKREGEEASSARRRKEVD